MLDTLTLVAYLLGNNAGHPDHLRLHAQFFGTEKQTVCAQKSESPQLRWSGVSPEATSLAVIIKDPSHYYWVVYNLPVDTKNLSFSIDHHMLQTNQGVNSWGIQAYHSRCWENRYHPVSVELFVLDTRFSNNESMSGKIVEEKMHGHILAKKIIHQ
ncbi:MAG: hypothetical protein A3C44_08390 [Gammaproteobacteria bacterium RIFCSPHIGHO2_02_FULL_39_13]|nr:MAG: hypothetical protein A3C44_08390 [Gammaproteobacteria bacterium RIFCSPHIGHO2_02_FULL_39_13]OGT49962.1 MAG: hypothetical protein A3E53_06285 [Gammaproteobacteria bacterium RIFCSPHIGHO2_12_FULL_39_24]